MIALESVSKRYGSKTIIHDVSFTVGKGEIVGFLGPNGAGKTTTMRMIAGYTTATSGRVTVAGFDMATQNEDAARKLGYVPEQPPLYDVLDVSDLSALRREGQGRARARDSTRSRPRHQRVPTGERVSRREIYKLSKGYRQRVGLAQALLGKPEVLLLDEPTAGLDPGQIQETREVIRAFGESHAVLLSTHILPEVTLICQRVAIINQGRLLAIDSPSGLQTGLRADQQRASGDHCARGRRCARRCSRSTVCDAVTMHPLPGARLLQSVECQVDAREGIEARIARAVASRWELHRLERQQPTLENIFLRYVGDTAQGEGRMNGVLAIYRKELQTYFRSPIAYFVVSVFLLGTGYFFLYNIFLTGIGTMDETFQNMGILLLTLIPVITMRLFSGEYSGRTMELLMTLPLKPWQIVLGKYLGAATMLLLMTAATAINLIPLYLYGNPETKTILSGYIGFVLLGMACLAVGQFFSSLTQNQIVAALITVPVLLGFWFVGHLQSFQTDYILREPVRLPFVRAALRRFHSRPDTQRSGDVLPGRQRHRPDPEHQLSAVAALTWTAPSVPF